MKKVSALALVAVMLLTVTGHASATDPVGVDCTNPPRLAPFADLRNCNLSGMNMDGIDLNNANLSGANLDAANLFSANLRYANLDNASLRNTTLQDADASHASFIGADLRGVDLYFAIVRNANLSGANLSENWLSSIDFEGSSLQGALFTGSSMSSVDLENTDLRGADLRVVDLYYSPMQHADLRNANLQGASQIGDGLLDGITWGNTICADGSNSDDEDGDDFTCETNFPANVAPAVALTSPASNSTVSKGGTVNISADAADSDGVVIRVQFYAGATLLNTDPTFPYSFDWITTVAGTYAVTAQAHDNDGAITTSQPVTVNVLPAPGNVPPTVKITSPKSNATVYRVLGTTIKVDAGDSDGSVTKVEFYAGSTLLGSDTSAPYNFSWRPSSTGNQTLTAKAFDDDGAVTTSASVNVRVR
jgi:uncharacterized protein YjbI with pentapeptide repeats